MNYQTNEDTVTAEAQARIAKTDDPRLKQVLEALVRHTHAFVKEIEPNEVLALADVFLYSAGLWPVYGWVV